MTLVFSGLSSSFILNLAHHFASFRRSGMGTGVT